MTATQSIPEVAMPAPALVQRLAMKGLGVCTRLAFLAPLLTRITVGYAFVLTGRGKLQNLDTFTEYLTSLGVPMAAQQAPLVAGLEFVGGICLVLGLLTRVMSGALAGTMVVAIATAEGAKFVSAWLPTGDVGPLDISPFVFLLLLTWLVLLGPGPVSLDRFLAPWAGVEAEVEKTPS
jgi:putative oxidoreductase